MLILYVATDLGHPVECPAVAQNLTLILSFKGMVCHLSFLSESPLTVIAMTDVIVESPKTTFAFPPWFTPAMKRRERQRLRRLKKRVFRRDQINRVNRFMNLLFYARIIGL